MKFNRLIPTIFIALVILVWAVVAWLNFSYLSQFVEHSFYWIEAVILLYVIVVRGVGPAILFKVGMILLISGAVFSLFGIGFSEIILRVAFVVWMFASTLNLFSNE